MARDLTLDGAAEAFSALSGADWGDLFLTRGNSRRAYFCDRKIEETSSSRSAGCSVRLLRGKYTARASVSGTRPNVCSSAFEQACRIAGLSAPALPPVPFPVERPTAYFPQDLSFCYDLDAKLRKECPWVTQVSISCSSGVTHAGLACAEISRMWTSQTVSCGVSVLLERNGKVESGSSFCAKRMDAERFFAELEPERLARNALLRALRNLDAAECPAGEMPVVLSSSAGGTIIHEACGHGMEADLAFEEHSCFAGKLGERVAPEFVTVVDDATLGGAYGSYEYDDEGVCGARTVLVENGILKNYLTDRRAAMLWHLPKTGNGRRSGYSSVPQPRMSNTFVAPGTEDEEGMISRAGHGLYVTRMGAGEVNPTTGEFVFEVDEGALIKNGAIDKPVKGATLIGTGLKALNGIRAVGKKLQLKSGICEKGGQGVPVTDGQPSLLIDGLIVGGTAME